MHVLMNSGGGRDETDDADGIKCSQSRRSSLESSEEPELVDIQQDFRPNTAHNRKVLESRGISGSETTQTPIEIPQATVEIESKVRVVSSLEVRRKRKNKCKLN